jgi:hypothetical protein
MNRRVDRNTLIHSIFLPKNLFYDAGYDRQEYDMGSRREHLRHYDHLKHAETRLNGGTSRYDAIDCITAIRRAIDFRITFLWSRYCLDRIQIGNKKRRLELLEHLGIARRLLIHEIYNIRNAVEHQETQAPPPKEDLERYIDIAWYFLRSTDWIFSKNNIMFFMYPSFQNSDQEPASATLTLNISPSEQWGVELDGPIPEDVIHAGNCIDHLEFKVDRPLDAFERRQYKGLNWIDIDYALLSDESAMPFIGRLYFNLAADQL